MTNRGLILDLERGLDELVEYTVVFFGEEHGSLIARGAEHILLSELSTRDPNLVLALEMFEQDVQHHLNAYLEGIIPEAAFLELARPWPNYQDDYRHLVELAKARRIPVIAANVPRRVAAEVAKHNELSPQTANTFGVSLPRHLHLNSKAYYERFAATLNKMPHSAPMKGLKVKALFKAQVLKDAVMAASLEPYLDRRILFCCGRFHSDYHLGIPYQLEKNHPELRVAVVVSAESVLNLPMKDRSRIADFIWIKK